MAGPIRISILANASQARREMDSTGKAAEGLGGKFKGMGKKFAVAAGAGVALAGAAVVKVGSEAVKSASDAQQSLGATETVFGKYADTIIKQSDRAAKSVGLSANSYRELSNVMGASLSGAGVPMKKTVALTEDLTKRAADMSATFGGTTEEAIASIGSLMRGEADPIEKYGVSIKQSDVNARLAAQGLSDLTGEGRKQAEMQARIDLLMQKTSKTQGAFKKESGTLAHQQQVLGAQFENIKAKVGTALLPVLTTLLTMLNNNLGPAFNKVVGFLSPLVAKVQEFFSGMGKGKSVLAPVLAVFSSVGQVVMSTVVPAVSSLISYLTASLLPVFSQVASIITGKVLPIFASIASFLVGTVVPAVVNIATKVGSNLKPVFDQLVATVQGKVLPAVSKVLDRFKEWLPTLQRVIKVVLKVVGKVLELASAILGKVLPVVIRFAGFLIGKVVTAVTAVIGVVIKVIGKIIDFGAAVGRGAKKVGEFAAAVGRKIADVVKFFAQLPSKIKGAIGNAGTMLLGIGKNIVQGLINGLDSGRQWIIDKISSLGALIPGWLKRKLGIASPSRVTKRLGVFVAQGLADGIALGSAAVAKQTDKIANRIEKVFDKRFKNDKKADRNTKTALRSIKDEQKAVRRNARAYDSLVDRIKAAKDALAAARQQAADFAASIRDAVVESANITSLGKVTSWDGVEGISLDALFGDLTEKAQEAKQYRLLIAQLTRDGLNDTTLQQLLNAGVQGGLATAEAIAAGGRGAIARINDLTGQIAAEGTALGNDAAQRFHGAGVAAAEGLVAGLEQMMGRVEKTAQKLANKLAKAIKKALKIKSPSRLFRDIGKHTGQGLVIGLDDAKVQRAGQVLARDLVTGFGSPRLSAREAYDKAATAGGAATTYQINITAPVGSDPAVIGKDLRRYIDAYERTGGRRRA